MRLSCAQNGGNISEYQDEVLHAPFCASSCEAAHVDPSLVMRRVTWHTQCMHIFVR